MPAEHKTDSEKENALMREDVMALYQHFQGDAFGQLLADPGNWRSLAQGLLRSGDLIAEAHRRSFTDEGTVPNPKSAGRIVVDEWKLVDMQIHLMAAVLYGYAIEVMSKGIVIKQRRLDPATLSCMPANLKTHDIAGLLDTAGVQLDYEEQEIIPFLHECVVWMGRYPVPLEDPVARSKWLEGYALSGTHFADAKATVRRLYHKLCIAWNAA